MTFLDIVEKVKQINNISSFNPMQSKAIDLLYENQNLVVSSPTSSGKTLVAETYSINTILNKKKRVLYLSPLKALALEQYNSFKKKYSILDIKTAISIGDLDSSSKNLSNYHMIFLTYEKLDSLIRHRSDFLSSVGLIIIDELHMIDTQRGPVLESSIVQLNMNVKNLQIIGLSATIPNSYELAEWLSAKHIESNFRPVVLRKGVMIDNKIFFDDKSELEIQGYDNQIESVIIDTLKMNKQAIVFTNTRKNAESLAKKLSVVSKSLINPIKVQRLIKEIDKLDFENLTEFDKKAIELIKQGIAFHHAGLRSQIREIIEDEFRLGNILVIVSTSTLSAGLNMPAYRVLIHSLYKHSEMGIVRIPVKEYLQMSGRAGRLGYDTQGEAIIFAKDETEFERCFEEYVYANSEEIESQLGIVPILRMIMLGLIANESVYNDNTLNQFFEKTFYAKRYNNLYEMRFKIKSILEDLIEYGFVEIKEDIINITNIGRRVSELYIDPLSANNIIKKIKRLKENMLDDLTFLYSVVDTYELKPYIKPNKNFEENLNYNEFGLTYNEILEDYDSSSKLITAKILNEWIEEFSEQEILEKYSIMPGILQNKINNAEWVTYAISEIAKILDENLIYKKAISIQKRLKAGIKDDLLELIELPNIGRIRARKLTLNNIKSVNDVKLANSQILVNILGSKIAKKLLDHLKVPTDIEVREKKNTLFDY